MKDISGIKYFPIRKKYVFHDILINFHRLFTCKILGHNLKPYQDQYKDNPSKFFWSMGCFRCCTFEDRYERQ